jgi:hypothetical protein
MAVLTHHLQQLLGFMTLNSTLRALTGVHLH